MRLRERELQAEVDGLRAEVRGACAVCAVLCSHTRTKTHTSSRAHIHGCRWSTCRANLQQQDLLLALPTKSYLGMQPRSRWVPCMCVCMCVCVGGGGGGSECVYVCVPCVCKCM